MASKINFQDVGAFALLGGICKMAQACAKNSSLYERHRIPIMKTMNLSGAFFHATALYYFSHPQLKNHATFYNLTGIIWTIGGSIVQLGVGEKGRTHPIFSIAHVSIEMIVLGALIASSIGVIVSKEHRSVCLAATFMQTPYWALKFYAEVPHFYERPILRTLKMPAALQEMTEENVLYLNREGLVDRVLDVICADIPNNNLLLAGNPGSGKTTLLAFLSAQIRKGNLPDLEGFRVFETTGPDIIAGARHVGDKEERINEIFTFLKGIKEKTILFIDEIWQLIGTGIGERGTTDIAGILLKKLEDRKVIVVGATTPTEGMVLLRNKAFVDRFQLQSMPPMSQQQRVQIMDAHIQKYQEKGISIPNEYASAIVEMNMKKNASLRKDVEVLGVIAARMKRKGISAEQAAQEREYSFAR